MHETRNLAVCAAATAAVYALLPAQFPLTGLVSVPQLDLGSATGREFGAAALGAAGTLSVYLAYAIAYKLARRIETRTAPAQTPALAIVLGGTAVFSAILVWTYPVGAVDIYDYAFRARMWVAHGLNPLVVPPDFVNGDAWLPYVAWTAYPSPYGALWTSVSAAIYWMAGPDLPGNLLLLKVLEAACLLGAAVLIHETLRGTGSALSGALLAAWNPLVLFELAANGHNDGLLMLLVVGSLYLFERRQQRLAAWVCLALAAQVKIIAVAFVPVLIVATLLREREHQRSLGHRLRSLLTGTLAFSAVWALMYVPWWAGVQTLGAIWLLQERFTSSFAAVIKLGLEAVVPAFDAGGLVAPAFGLAAAGSVVIVLWRGWQFRHAARYMALGAVWPLLCLGTLWFQPWYAVWLVTLAPFGGPVQRRAAVLVSAGALALYALYDFAWFWQPAFFNAGNTLMVNMAAVALWLVIPLTALWINARRKSSGLPRSGS